MSDLLIRNMAPALKRRIKERARRNQHSLSEEAKLLIESGLANPARPIQASPDHNLGTYLFSLLEDKYRGDDLVFEIEDYPEPPDFE